MEIASPVISPVQQAVPAVSGSPATSIPSPAPAPAPAPAPVVGAPGAVGAAFPQPQLPSPVGGTPGTPAAAAPAVAPAVQPSQSPEYLALQREHQRVLAEIQRLTPYAAIGYRSQQAPVPAAPAPVAPGESRVGVPELDPMVSAYVTERDGQIVELPGAPPGTLAAYHKHQRDMATFLRSFTTNPEKALGPVVEKLRAEAVEEAKKQFAAEQRAQQEQQSARQILAENSAWMYERDASGNVAVDFDPMTGRQNPRLSEGGKWWAEAVESLTKQGVTDPVTLNNYAKSHAHLMAWQRHEQMKQAAAAAGTPVPAPAPAPASPFGVPGIVPVPSATAAPTLASMVMGDPRMAFLAKVPGAMPGQYNPPPASTVATPTIPARVVNPIQDWKNQALQAMYAAGYNQNSRLPVGGAA